MGEPLLEIRGLITSYSARGGLFGGELQAVAGVDLDVAAGETLGLVGESGSGKTSIARSIVRLVPPKAGTIKFEGRDLATLRPAELRRLRRNVQMIFQDPYASLNPRMTVRQLVGEGWEIHPDIVPRSQRQKELGRLLELVGMNPDHADRYPHQFSGGQRQRIGIARALAVRPRLLVCDEPVSALDASIQAQIINLLVDLQKELGLAYLFISHDLGVIRRVSDRIAVMYLGRIVETGPVEDVYLQPTHPYTLALLSATLPHRPWQSGRMERIILRGDVPSALDPPSGCRFRTRCWRAQALCAEVEPVLISRETGTSSACHFPITTWGDTASESNSKLQERSC
jgi:oligopeptide transport system ATP-binding protein